MGKSLEEKVHFFPKKFLFVEMGELPSFPFKILQQGEVPSEKAIRLEWYWLFPQSFLCTVPESALMIASFSNEENTLLHGKFLFFVARNFSRSIKQIGGYLSFCLTPLSLLVYWLSDGWLMSTMEKQHCWKLSQTTLLVSDLQTNSTLSRFILFVRCCMGSSQSFALKSFNKCGEVPRKNPIFPKDFFVGYWEFRNFTLKIL